MDEYSKEIFRWAILVVLDMMTISRQGSQAQLIHILFIACTELQTTAFNK
jgi:hypothetical protein